MTNLVTHSGALRLSQRTSSTGDKAEAHRSPTPLFILRALMRNTDRA